MRRLIAIVLMSVFSVVCVLSQEVVFGKNKVQYKKFDWQFIQSDHFDIYFAQSGYELASFTANAAEDAYHSIK